MEMKNTQFFVLLYFKALSTSVAAVALDFLPLDGGEEQGMESVQR